MAVTAGFNAVQDTLRYDSRNSEAGTNGTYGSWNNGALLDDNRGTNGHNYLIWNQKMGLLGHICNWVLLCLLHFYNKHTLEFWTAVIVSRLREWGSAVLRAAGNVDGILSKHEFIELQTLIFSWLALLSDIAY